MPGRRLVRLLVKLPVPVPSDVLASAVVGLAVVDQHTPRAVTSDPPLLVTSPPEVAVVRVILVTAAAVVTVGIASAVVAKVRSFP